MNLPCRFGRYTLVEKVANGGTAEVYRALLTSDSGFIKTVAIKKLLPSWDENDELRHMLVDEANVLCLLAHQSIVQVYELGSEDSTPFIAMEFVDGIDCGRLLTHIIREPAPLDAPHALYIVSQVLTALEFAHRCEDASGRPLGIVHRDISPSNILLSWNGEVKVTDFGIAKGSHRTRFTTAGQIRGKYAYMAPEQARGEQIDARADIFACGILLYELLTGRRLFDGETDVELLRTVAHAEIKLAGIERLSAELRATIMLALSPRAETRYQSAAEMLSDVRRAARSVGEISSSLDLAAYLHDVFPDGTARTSPRADVVEHTGAKTRAMEPCFLPAETHRHSFIFPLSWRSAAATFMFIAMSFVPHARVSALGIVRPVSTDRAAAQIVQQRPDTPGVPPAVAGAVAIDSAPAGARGILLLGTERREIVTPFTIENIQTGGDIDCRVELSAAGYAPISESFRLGPASPAYVKSFALKRVGAAAISITAKPWGIASISGVAQGRETPLAGVKVKPGAYSVKVAHPPSGRTVEARVVLAEGQSKNCFASFGEQSAISCR